jgi:hypothetical protein
VPTAARPALPAYLSDGRILVALLAAVTVGPALAIGGVHTETHLVLLGFAGLCSTLLCLYRVANPKRALFVPRLLTAAMVAALGFTLLQVVPLPRWLLHLLDPAGLALRDLASDAAPPRWAPLSLSPAATIHELGKQLCWIIWFLCAANFLHRGRRALTVLRTFVFAGSAIAGLGLLHHVFQLEHILGFYKPSSTYVVMAPFVNKNHAAGFLLLVVATAIGLMHATLPRGRIPLLAAIAVSTVALLVTGSRGGLVGLLVVLGGLVAFGLRDVASRRNTLRLAIVLAPILGAGFLVAHHEVTGRIAEAIHAPAAANAKLQTWRDTLALTWQFRWTGIGRGAFAEVFPHFNRANPTETFTHPENELLQLAAEWGWPVTLALAALTLVGLLHIVRRARLDGLGQAVLMGLCGLGLQNLADFNLEFAGTAAPATILLGVLAARTRPKIDRARVLPHLVLLRAAALPAAAVLVLLVDTFSSRHLIEAQDRTLSRLLQQAPTLATARSEVEAAVVRHPADYRTHLVAAHLYLRFRDPHGLRHLNVAMTLVPEYGPSHLEAARALVLAGYRDQAALEYRAAFERNVPMGEAAVTELLARCGPASGAWRGVPDTPQAQLYFGWYLQHRKADRGGARQAYQRALALARPGETPALDALRYLVQLDPPDQVGVSLQLARDAKTPTDVVLAAEGLARAGRKELASRVWLDALTRFGSQWSVVEPAVEVLLAGHNPLAAERALRRLVEQSGGERREQIAALEKLATIQDELGQTQSARHSRMLAAQLRSAD